MKKIQNFIKISNFFSFFFNNFRREMKIREHNEKIARATQQKENELREKIRRRQENDLQKQKGVLDRRCAQLEKDKAKKAVNF